MIQRSKCKGVLRQSEANGSGESAAGASGALRTTRRPPSRSQSPPPAPSLATIPLPHASSPACRTLSSPVCSTSPARGPSPPVSRSAPLPHQPRALSRTMAHSALALALLLALAAVCQAQPLRPDPLTGAPGQPRGRLLRTPARPCPPCRRPKSSCRAGQAVGASGGLLQPRRRSPCTDRARLPLLPPADLTKAQVAALQGKPASIEYGPGAADASSLPPAAKAAFTRPLAGAPLPEQAALRRRLLQVSGALRGGWLGWGRGLEERGRGKRCAHRSSLTAPSCVPSPPPPRPPPAGRPRPHGRAPCPDGPHGRAPGPGHPHAQGPHGQGRRPRPHGRGGADGGGHGGFRHDGRAPPAGHPHRQRVAGRRVGVPGARRWEGGRQRSRLACTLNRRSTAAQQPPPAHTLSASPSPPPATLHSPRPRSSGTRAAPTRWAPRRAAWRWCAARRWPSTACSASPGTAPSPWPRWVGWVEGRPCSCCSGLPCSHSS